MTDRRKAVVRNDPFQPDRNGLQVEVVGPREPMPWRVDHTNGLTQYGYNCRFPDGSENLVWEQMLAMDGAA
jgi:hypothetical protein